MHRLSQWEEGVCGTLSQILGKIIIDRKEAGGLPSSTFLNLAPEKQEKLLSAAVREAL